MDLPVALAQNEQEAAGANTIGSRKLSRRMAMAAARRTGGGGGFYEVAFSDAEESVLKERQGETLEMLARTLGGRSVQEVQRRCVELGLRCGRGAAAPPKGSEKWRVIPPN